MAVRNMPPYKCGVFVRRTSGNPNSLQSSTVSHWSAAVTDRDRDNVNVNEYSALIWHVSGSEGKFFQRIKLKDLRGSMNPGHDK